MNIVLTGFMATGKTTVGQLLAEMTGCKFADTDDMIVQREGRSINDIFADDGEAYFRRVEREVIEDAAALSNTVISTGGGVVLNPENIEILRKTGRIFNLSPDFSVIAERITNAASTRPLLQNQSLSEIEQRFNGRKPYYDNCDYKIQITSKSTPITTARQIINIMHKLK